MMLIHHLFRSGAAKAFDLHTINCYPLHQYQLVNFADFSKLCVSLFAFISGYGLYSSLSHAKEYRHWIKNQYIKSLSGFWIIVIAQWIFHIFYTGIFFDYYFSDNFATGIMRLIIEFCGLSSLFGFSQIDGGWWYMSAAIVFIFLAPCIYMLIGKIGSIGVLGLSCIVPYLFGANFQGNSFVTYLPIFVLGMVFAADNIFDKIHSLVKSSKLSYPISFLGMAIITFLAYKLYQNLDLKTFWLIKYIFIPIPIIVFCVEFIMKLPVLKNILSFLGRHATNIYLTHILIRWYFNDFVYKSANAIIIFMTLLISSLILSVIVELFKRLIKYRKLISCFTDN